MRNCFLKFPTIFCIRNRKGKNCKKTWKKKKKTKHKPRIQDPFFIPFLKFIFHNMLNE